MTASSNVEREIVQMYFDAKQFREGIRESMKEMEALKKSFEMDAAKRNFRELEKASRVDFSPLSNGISALNGKISVMGIATATLINNLTNSVIEGAKKMFDALVIAPVRTGLQEYETQLNSIQTILANTKKEGTELADVVSALDELNLYADKTIYNFTQMTKNIGTFTAAGVKLETSVSAIKGIANLAAVSGSDANQASNAMYQLSQAIASGTVKLMDWNSVQNAGMGGQVFQDALLETARVHGVAVDKMIEEQGSFRESLSKGWLSSDILLETLSKFTGDLTDAQLASMGYTEEQIKGIQEMAVTANDAATKIKTLTQLKDTLSEALQSGWAETWRYIFGDFDQAKELWGALGDIFGDMIGRSSEARNKMLKFWSVAGGREELIRSVFNLIEVGRRIVSAFQEAISDIFRPLKAGDLLNITRRLENFTEKLLDSTENLEVFKRIVRGVAAIFDLAKMAAWALLRPIVKLVERVAGGSGGFFEWVAGIADSIVAFREYAIKVKFFHLIVEEALHRIGNFIDKLKELGHAFLELEVVQDVISWFKGIEKSDFIAIWEGIKNVATALVAPFYLLAQGAKWLYEEVSNLSVVEDLAAWFKELSWQGVKDSFSDMSDSIKEFFENLKNAELVQKFLLYIDTFDGRRFKEFWGELSGRIEGVSEALGKFNLKLGGTEKASKDANANLDKVFEGIKKALSDVLDFLIKQAENLDYSVIFQAINTGLFAGLVLSIKKFAGGGWFKDALDNVLGGDSAIGGVGESLQGMFGQMESTLTSFQNNIKADTLQKIAIAIGILAISLIALTWVDSTKLAASTAAIAVMAGSLFGGAGALSKINSADALKSSAVLITLSGALLITAVALRKISAIAPYRIESSILAMVAGLSALVVGVRGLGSGTSQLKTVGVLLGLAVSLRVLVGVIQKYGELEPEVFKQGLLGIATALGLLVGAVGILSKLDKGGMLTAALALTDMAFALGLLSKSVVTFGEMDVDILAQGLKAVGVILAGFALFSQLVKPSGLIKAGVAITIISGALFLMVEVIRSLGGMDWEEVKQALLTLAIALGIIAIAAQAMSGGLGGAASLLIMSVAIGGLALSLKLLSTIPWQQLLISLGGLAAVFLILGVAGYLLTPVVPTLLLLGGAMALIGAGALLMGAGLALASVGLIAIAGSGVAIAGAIGILGEAIIKLLPKLGSAIAESLTSFMVTIGENTPKLIEAFKSIILGMITATAELIPDIVIVVLDMVTALLTAIAERIPDLVQAGYDILLGFLKGIEDNIKEVVTTALGIVTEFIDGIAEGLPQLVESAYNLLLNFLTAIDEAVVEYTPQIVETGMSIAGHIIEGIVDGLIAGVSGLIQTVKNVVGTVINAFTGPDGIQAESPSRVFYNAAGDIVDGLVLGLKDGQSSVREAFTSFAKNAQNGIVPMIQRLASDIDQSIEINPVIRPVMDLDELKSGATKIARAIGGSVVLSELSYADARGSVSAGPQVNGSYQDSGYVFNQYNYSPVALDRETIYRQTKTLVASRSKRAFE